MIAEFDRVEIRKLEVIEGLTTLVLASVVLFLMAGINLLSVEKTILKNA